jgi:hypothetical protein
VNIVGDGFHIVYLRKLFVVALFAVAMMSLGESAIAQGPTGQTEVGLALRIEKRTIRAGEPIDILVYLENASSSSSYFVGRELGGGFSYVPYHYIELELKDENGKPLEIGRGVAHPLPWPQGTTVADKVAEAYVVLAPGVIYGFKRRGKLLLKPGKYTIVANYREVEAAGWSAKEKQSLEHPIWVSPLTSNKITVTVR